MAGLIFATGFPPAIADSEELKTVVPELYINSVKTVNTFRQTGRISFGDMEGKVEILFKAPDRIVTNYDLGELKFSQVYDGKTAWMIDQNGQVLEMTGNEKQKVINTAYMSGFSYLLPDRIPGKVIFVSDTLLSDTAFRIFEMYPEGGDSIRVFINSSTGRIELTEEYIDEVMVKTFQEDFRTVQGVEFPFVYRVESTVPQLNSTMVFSELEINPPIPDSVFHLEAASKIDYQFPDKQDSVVVPIKFVNGHIFVMASVNGSKEVYFILDSGAGSNIIDKTYAERQNLPLVGEVASKGVAGYETASLTHLDSVRVGQVQLNDQTAAVADLSTLKLAYPDTIGGLLGYDFISRFPVRINYSAVNMVLYNPASFHEPDSANAVAIDFLLKIPVVSATIDSVNGRFLVDLGNSLGLIIHKSFSDKFNLESGFADIKKMGKTLGGIGGDAVAYAATGKSFRIGRYTLQNPPLLIAAGNAGVIRSDDVDGNVGNLMLMKFDVLFNYSRREIYLFPNDKEVISDSETK